MEKKQVEGTDCLVVQDAAGNSSFLPLYCLPRFVVAFALRDLDKEPIETDNEYFGALLACEFPRLLVDSLGATLQSDIYIRPSLIASPVQNLASSKMVTI